MRAKAHDPQPIVPANVAFEEGALSSRDFGDIYFSRSGGVEESLHVFLGGNALSSRFELAERFTVGELGFGTGLNFLLTLREWRSRRCRGARLFYLSYELHPLRRDELRRALEMQLGEGPEIEALIAQYPPLIEGLHVLDFDGFGVTLYLFFGSAREKLQETETPGVDAWFLDGFAPDKNPELWSPEILSEVSKLSRENATLATYSVRSSVRSTLNECGWTLEKVPGVGRKREVLRGYLSRGQPSERACAPKRVAVIGGGIAGASCAGALARRGVAVTLFERDEELCRGASGNEQAIAIPYLSAERDRRHRFYVTGFLHLLRTVLRFGLPREAGGALFLPARERQRGLEEKVRAFGFPSSFCHPVSAAEASELAGVPLERSGLAFPEGFSFSLRSAAEAVLGSSVERRLSSPVLQVRDFDVVVVATGASLELLPGELQKLITPVMGEVGQFRSSGESRNLRRILCGDGYCLPEKGGLHLVGATYHRGIATSQPTLSGASQLLDIANRFFPIQGPVLNLRASVRATTPDRMPVVDVVNHGGAVTAFTVGHGSRGGVSAFLAAEQLAAELCHEPFPIERSILKGLRMARFRN